jgi:AraC-like DNA-binding protein
MGLAGRTLAVDLPAMTIEMDELRELALRHVGDSQTGTAIPRVAIHLGQCVTGPLPGLYEPMVCLILQGAKCVMIGDHILHYDTASYFVASVDVPATGRIMQASIDRPYLAVSLAFDPAVIADVLTRLPLAPVASIGVGFGVSPVTAELMDAWTRLLRLLDTPEDIGMLAPLIEQEIVYRLLVGPQGGMLRQIAMAESRLARVRRAIAWIRTHYDAPFRIEEAASLAGMSASAFHRHFKAVTAMSPLQYQKRLRLQQARRLLLAGAGDAARAAYAVGYESASQFSREYTRLFGAPPTRDAARLRADPGHQGEPRAAA